MKFVMSSSVCVVFLVMICGVQSYSDVCTQSKVSNCFSSFLTKWGKQQDGVASFEIKRSEQTMHQLCHDYDMAKQCLSPFLKDCDDISKVEVKQLNAVYSYLCGDGLQDFLKHQDCLADPAVVSKLRVCNETAKARLTEISKAMSYMKISGTTTHDRAEAQKDKLCKTAHDLVQCSQLAVDSPCGEDAAEFIRKLLDITLAPALNKVNCDGSAGFQVWYAVATVAGLLITALIGWCVGMYIQSRRRTARSLHSDRTMLTTSEEFYDDPPLYRSQVQVHQAQLQPLPYSSHDYTIHPEPPGSDAPQQDCVALSKAVPIV